MRRGMSRRALVSTIVLAIALAVAPAHAGKKSVVSARIGGKKLAGSGRLAFASYNAPILIVSGTVRRGRTVRTIALGCILLPPPTQFPYQCDGNSNYQEVVTKRPPVVKGWGTVHGMHLTIERFDATRVVGSFAGAYDFGNANNGQSLAPISVEGGRFDVAFRH